MPTNNYAVKWTAYEKDLTKEQAVELALGWRAEGYRSEVIMLPQAEREMQAPFQNLEELKAGM